MAGKQDGFLLKRAHAFALRIIKLVNRLPGSGASDVLGSQVLGSATSVGANCRATCRSRSRAEFCAKLDIVEEEADETGYWLSLLGDSQLARSELLVDLRKEAHEILAMIITSIKTAQSRKT